MMPQKRPQKQGKKTPRKYLRAAALSAVFAAVAIPATAEAQSYHPSETATNSEMRSAATSFQYSYRNLSELPLRRLDSCTHVTAEPQINSTVTVKETVYDHTSLTVADLDALHHNFLPDSTQTLGVTSGNYSYSVNVSGTTYRVNGEDCIHLKDIDIDVTFSQKIQTAAELLDHSCHKDDVTEHEELHAMFNKTAIENYGAVIDDLVKANAEKVNGRVVPRGKTATDVISEMQALFSGTVRDTLEAAVKKADTKHSRIDTFSNYLKEQKETEKKCGYELPRFSAPKN